MKRLSLYSGLLFLLLFAGCGKDTDELLPAGSPADADAQHAEKVPEGYFVASFGPDDLTRTQNPTAGTDARVQHIRYLLFDAATGNFVKERIVWLPSQGAPFWPLSGVLRDTLPNGTYKAVFLGNVEKTLFPYKSSYYDVLTGYTMGYANARIWLPRTDFSSTTEYYMGKADVSNAAPNPSVYLQRIIGAASLHRNTIDAQQALNTLVGHIVDQLHYRDLLTTQVNALLPGLLTTALNGIFSLLGPLNILNPLYVLFQALGAVDGLVNKLVTPLVAPIVDALLSGLVNQIGMALTGNTDQSGMLASLGVILNPWTIGDARTAIVTINNFPKAIDFDLNVTDRYTGLQRFAYDFAEMNVYAQKNVYIRGFGQGTQVPWDIRHINVIKHGIVPGLVVDDIADDLLLHGALVDIDDPLTLNASPNIRYRDDYSLLDVKLKDYTAQTDGQHDLTLTVKLGDIANLNNLLDGLGLGLLTDIVFGLISNVQVSTSLNLPLLGIDNLELSGSWDIPKTDQEL